MNKNDVLKMLNILQVTYPNFYKGFSKQELQEAVSLYQEMFKDDDSKLVFIALKEVINTSEYPPTIATIKNKMFNMTHKENDNTDLWNKLKNAIGRSSYYAQEEFDKLPEILKKYVRSPQRLQELASMDSDLINSVEKGIFMKQIENIKQQVKNNEIVGRKDNLLMKKGIYQLEDFENEI